MCYNVAVNLRIEVVISYDQSEFRKSAVDRSSYHRYSCPAIRNCGGRSASAAIYQRLDPAQSGDSPLH